MCKCIICVCHPYKCVVLKFLNAQFAPPDSPLIIFRNKVNYVQMTRFWFAHFVHIKR